MKRNALFVVSALALLFSFSTAHAALSESQIQSILSLINSFGADQATVAQVGSALSDDYGTGSTITSSGTYCPQLSRTMQRGARDSTTGGQVTELQLFLADYFGLNEEGIVTGYFGRLTQGYVADIQKKNGLPAYGIVGSLTRALIARLCGSLVSTPTVQVTPTTPSTSSTSSNSSPLSILTDPSSAEYYSIPAGFVDPVFLGAYSFLNTGQSPIEVSRIGVTLTSGSPSSVGSLSAWRDNNQLGVVLAGGRVIPATFTVAPNERVTIFIKGMLSPVSQGGVSGDLIKVNANPTATVAVDTATGQKVTPTGGTDVAGVRIFRSLPIVTSDPLPNTGLSDGRLLRFKVAASSYGNVSLAQIALRFTGLAAGTNGQADLYAFTDPGYSSPVSGFPNGAINGLLVSSGANAGQLWFTNQLLIPAGVTRYFELRDSTKGTGLTNTSSLTTTLLGQTGYAGLVTADSLKGKDAGFIWSPNSNGIPSFSSVDWTNGYAISGLPASGLSMTRTGGSSSSGLAVTAPNGGEQWEIGQLNTITWSPYGYNPDVNPANQVSVYLQRTDGSTVGQIKDTGKASLHTYFNINDYQTWAQPGSYYVYAKNNVTGAADKSDKPFTLLPRSVDLKVNSSDGPVSLTVGQTIRLSWRTTRDVEQCRIYGVRVGTSLLSDGSYGNLSPNGDLNGVYLGGTIQMVCTKYNVGEWGDTVYVNSISSNATLRVISPNGGENITGLQPMTVTYDATGVKSVSIALYMNDQYLKWVGKDIQLPTSGAGGKPFSYSWNEYELGLSDAGNVFKIYITGQKADGTGYVDDKSDKPFGFASVNIPSPVLTASPSSGVLSTLGGYQTLWVDFNVTNYTPVGTEIIDFGDGTYSALGYTTSTNSRHDYHTPGIYTVKLQKDGAKGEVLTTTTVTVLASPATPEISFTASPSTITQGQTSVLSWNALNATRCSLDGASVGIRDSKTVGPSQTTAYTLVCYNDPVGGKEGPSTQSTFTIQVVAPSLAIVVGAYEAANSGHTFGYHPEGSITVNITGGSASNVAALVLTSYEPVNWIINNPQNLTLPKIITIGYYNQRVTGAPAGTVIESHSYQSDGIYAYAYQNTGSAYQSLVNWLQGKGLGVGNFMGNYYGSSYDVYLSFKG